MVPEASLSPFGNVELCTTSKMANIAKGEEKRWKKKKNSNIYGQDCLRRENWKNLEIFLIESNQTFLFWNYFPKLYLIRFLMSTIFVYGPAWKRGYNKALWEKRGKTLFWRSMRLLKAGACWSLFFVVVVLEHLKFYKTNFSKISFNLRIQTVWGSKIEET